MNTLEIAFVAGMSSVITSMVVTHFVLKKYKAKIFSLVNEMNKTIQERHERVVKYVDDLNELNTKQTKEIRDMVLSTIEDAFKLYTHS